MLRWASQNGHSETVRMLQEAMEAAPAPQEVMEAIEFPVLVEGLADARPESVELDDLQPPPLAVVRRHAGQAVE